MNVVLSAPFHSLGNENPVPLGKTGLGQPPDPESKPLRLMINLFGFKVARPTFSSAPE